jgi:hypothetical protein
MIPLYVLFVVLVLGVVRNDRRFCHRLFVYTVFLSGYVEFDLLASVAVRLLTEFLLQEVITREDRSGGFTFCFNFFHRTKSLLVLIRDG